MQETFLVGSPAASLRVTSVQLFRACFKKGINNIILPVFFFAYFLGNHESGTLKTITVDDFDEGINPKTPNRSQGKLLWDAGKISPGSRGYEIRQINLKCVATGKLTWYVISFSILRYRSIFGYRSYIRSITSLVFSKGSTHL